MLSNSIILFGIQTYILLSPLHYYTCFHHYCKQCTTKSQQYTDTKEIQYTSFEHVYVTVSPCIILDESWFQVSRAPAASIHGPCTLSSRWDINSLLADYAVFAFPRRPACIARSEMWQLFNDEILFIKLCRVYINKLVLPVLKTIWRHMNSLKRFPPKHIYRAAWEFLCGPVVLKMIIIVCTISEIREKSLCWVSL